MTASFGKCLDLLRRIGDDQERILALVPNESGGGNQFWEVIDITEFYDHKNIVGRGDSPKNAINNAMEQYK